MRPSASASSLTKGYDPVHILFVTFGISHGKNEGMLSDLIGCSQR